jgi:predicted transcriptional regulator YdeE
VVKITYLSLGDHYSERKLEPFALYTTRGNWILIAFCRNKQDFRAFRLDRIQTLTVLEEKFEPHDYTLEQYLEACRKKWEPTPDIPLTPEHSTFAVNQNKLDMQQLSIEPFKLIGISVRTTNEGGQAATDIAELWGRFMAEKLADKIPNKVDDTVYSLYTDYESDHTGPYTALLGCRVETLEDVPEGMSGRSFSGGNYVKLMAKGDLTRGLIVNKWSQIWELDLDRAFTADFEVFGEKAQDPTNAEVDFLIAVQ